jgi:DHA1 family bicyclomycin/chloramphenicol resistance-like MFS transporter
MLVTTQRTAREAAAPTLGLVLILTLSLAAGITPFATDLYLPAFPSMTLDLDTSASVVQLTLTAFLVGAGCGQLVFGPLSDRFGRVAPLTVGMVVYLVASIAAATAPSIAILVLARFVQGFSGASGIVIGRAIIADLAQGAEAARAMSILLMVSVISPVLAPVVGSVLTEPIGWRGLLWIVTGMACAALAAVLLFVRETNPRHAGSTASPRARGETRRALLSRGYLGNLFAFSLSFAMMMAYISASPFLFQTVIGLGEIEFGVVFGVFTLMLMVVAGVSARLTHRVQVPTLARWGLRLGLGSCAVLTLLVLAGTAPYWLVIPIATAVASLGLVFGNVAALAMGKVPSAAGMASAVLGFTQHLLGGATVPLVGIAGEHATLPLALTMLVAAGGANLAFRIARN